VSHDTLQAPNVLPALSLAHTMNDFSDIFFRSVKLARSFVSIFLLILSGKVVWPYGPAAFALRWPLAFLKNVNLATLQKLVSLMDSFRVGAKIVQTCVVSCNRRFIFGFCVASLTKSGVSRNFLYLSYYHIL
jgi:hypothetical protein